MNKTSLPLRSGWRWLVVGWVAVMGLSVPISPVNSADAIDPEATKILQSMSAYLAATKAFSVNADIDFEIVTKNGQKLQLSSYATTVVQRPEKFYIQRKGSIANAEFVFDGKTLTVLGKKSNVYSQFNVAGSIDDAIRRFELETGVPTPGGDLLFANPYAILSNGVESSTYVGTTYINGIECYHLAFREDEVDWQIWVQTGDRPLPMKYVITSKLQAAAPQYEIRLRDWVTNPQINPKQFTFVAPQGARKLQTLPAIELDEFTVTKEGQR